MAEKVSFNAAEAWGLLDDRDYDKYDAVVGVRFCDNASRNLATFANRQTVVGERALTKKLSKWLFSKRMMQIIKANTSFCWSGDGNTWVTRTAFGKHNEIQVLLRATCRGEYCHVGVYAKRVRNGRISVLPAPTSPLNPRISPALTAKLTSWKTPLLSRFLTSKTVSPIGTLSFGYTLSSVLPTIISISSFCVTPSAGTVLMYSPSLRTVIRSVIFRISSRRWEI